MQRKHEGYKKENRGPIVVAVQWSQSGHALYRHGVTNEGTCWSSQTSQHGGGPKLESAKSLSQVRQKVLVLDSSFRKQGEGKVVYYACIMFLVALDSKQLFGERMRLHFLIQEFSILEQCHVELWLVALILTLSSG